MNRPMQMPDTAMTNEPPVVVRPSRDSDVDAMLSIYRRHIRRGIEEGVDDSGTPEPEDLHDRRKNLRNHRLPHLVATCAGEVVGYAYVVLFRKRPAYRFTVKHSIYVHHEHQGRFAGRALMQEIVDTCAAAGFRQMIGYIDADNTASLAMQKIRIPQGRPATGRRLSLQPLGRQRHGAPVAGGRCNRAAADIQLRALRRPDLADPGKLTRCGSTCQAGRQACTAARRP